MRPVLLLVLAALLGMLWTPEATSDIWADYPHCKDRCSGHGLCIDNTCHCVSTWTGPDCSQRTCAVVCQNGGQCVGSACECPPEWTGVDCSLRVCPNDCSGRGVCINGTCSCFASFVGVSCEISKVSCPNNCSQPLGRGECLNGICYCHDGWAGEDCTVHVCTRSCSGHGSCVVNGTVSFCNCNPGFSGTDCSNQDCGPGCEAHGTCDYRTGLCSCHLNWEGENCDKLVCHPGCGVHGRCELQNGRAICVCEEGWGGIDCSNRDCSHHCNYRGECDANTGVCQCPDEYAGADCSYTRIGNKHMRGCLTREHCNDHGLCVNTHCKCMAGYFGDQCQHEFTNRSMVCPNGCSGHGLCNYEAKCICVFPHSGPDCADQECLTNCGPFQECVAGVCVCANSSLTGPLCNRLKCPEACSHHGRCMTNNGSCVCDEGYVGVDCSLRRCPNDCSGNGRCTPNFLCECHTGWAGADCSGRRCPGDCSKNGVCDYDTGSCLCKEGWWGEDCSMPQCLDNSCSGHGECVNGTCVCTDSWSGPKCENRTCPRNCNSPRGGVCQPDFTCRCHRGFFGMDCFMIQPLNVSCPNHCSGKGHCVSQACVCEVGWSGEACDVPLCANRCNEQSLHGVCNASQVCECADGFSGLSCEKRDCSGGCNEPNGYCNRNTGSCECTPGHSGTNCETPNPTALAGCSGHGKVSNTSDSCVCDEGWTGFRCSEKKCPNQCSGHGVCADGTCLCDAGYEGEDCSFGSDKVNYKRKCDKRCAMSCIPRCKHVHTSSHFFDKYEHLDPYTALLDPPCSTDLKEATQALREKCTRPTNTTSTNTGV